MIAHECYFENTKGQDGFKLWENALLTDLVHVTNMISNPKGQRRIEERKVKIRGKTSDPEHFSTAIKGTIYI